MESGVPDLDRTDFAILRRLVRDARLAHVALSDQVGLSATACARRVRRLEEEGVIAGYRADLDLARLGYPVIVIVRITLHAQNEASFGEFEAAVARCGTVLSCLLMSGSDDYLLRVVARDIAHYEAIHKEDLSRLPHVARIQSSFALREVVRRDVAGAILG